MAALALVFAHRVPAAVGRLPAKLVWVCTEPRSSRTHGLKGHSATYTSCSHSCEQNQFGSLFLRLAPLASCWFNTPRVLVPGYKPGYPPVQCISMNKDSLHGFFRKSFQSQVLSLSAWLGDHGQPCRASSPAHRSPDHRRWDSSSDLPRGRADCEGRAQLDPSGRGDQSLAHGRLQRVFPAVSHDISELQYPKVWLAGTPIYKIDSYDSHPIVWSPESAVETHLLKRSPLILTRNKNASRRVLLQQRHVAGHRLSATDPPMDHQPPPPSKQAPGKGHVRLILPDLLPGGSTKAQS